MKAVYINRAWRPSTPDPIPWAKVQYGDNPWKIFRSLLILYDIRDVVAVDSGVRPWNQLSPEQQMQRVRSMYIPIVTGKQHP